MRKMILIGVIFLLSNIIFGQNKTNNVILEYESIPPTKYLIESDSISPSIKYFVGLSISKPFNNYDISTSVEFGGKYKTHSISIMVGEDNYRNDTWVKTRVTSSIPTKYVEIYGLVGVGSYIKNDNIFIEYGVGILKDIKILTLYIEINSHLNNYYLSPGVKIKI